MICHSGGSSAIELLGDRWVLLILAGLRTGEKRFTDLQRTLGINPLTLSGRLKTLEAAGLLERLTGTVNKQAVSYRLSPRGQAALPVLDALAVFEAELPQ